jgi:hypothetical protein
MGDRGFPHAVSGFLKPNISIFEPQNQEFPDGPRCVSVLKERTQEESMSRE